MRKTLMRHLKERVPTLTIANVYDKWFATHSIRTPLITDGSMAIYAEDTDIDSSYLCKLEARKRKVLRRIMMLETVQG